MLEKIFIFLIFLCPLVFFHELGHFLFARLFGVRVEVFSLGFGPKLFKFKRGDTEYAFSLIPLGGYVKMFGDDPLSMNEIPFEERAKSFTHKGKFARFWIVLGGPLANFLLAFVLFYSLMIAGEKIPEMKFGGLPPQHEFYQMGLRSGDVLHKVNGVKISGPTDIPMDKSTMLESIAVERHGNVVEVKTDKSAEDFFKIFFQSPPALRKPILADKNGNRFELSLKEPQGLSLSLEEMVDYPTPKTLILKSEAGQEEISIASNDPNEFYRELFARELYPVDLLVKSVSMNSSADQAGLVGGDVIFEVNGKSVQSFEELRAEVQNEKFEEIELGYWRNSEKKLAKVKPLWSEQNGKKVRVIGVYSAVEFQGISFVNTEPKGLLESIPLAILKTWDGIVKTVDGFKKLLTNEVSLKNIGGPIAIGKVASDSLNTSLSYFFQLMALISINLGIINLFPIPVLDGGHIMFIFLEILNRGPLSRRKMEIAQQFGLSLLLILTFAALFNDISRLF